MKIGLCGPHGSGKTTLSLALSEILGIPATTVSCSTLAANKMGYEKSADIPKEEILSHQWLGLTELIKLQAKHNSYITDRSVVDFFAYFMSRTNYHQKTAHNDQYKLCVQANIDYDHLFFVKSFGKKVEDDNRRFTSDPKPIEDNIEWLIKEWQIKNVHIIKAISVEDRIAEILEIINA